MSRGRGLLGAIALAGALTGLLYLPICNLAFRCGCTWFFLQGSAHCNIHNSTPPHCPACTRPGVAGAFGALLFAGAFATSLPLARRLSRSPR